MRSRNASLVVFLFGPANHLNKKNSEQPLVGEKSCSEKYARRHEKSGIIREPRFLGLKNDREIKCSTLVSQPSSSYPTHFWTVTLTPFLMGSKSSLAKYTWLDLWKVLRIIDVLTFNHHKHLQLWPFKFISYSCFTVFFKHSINGVCQYLVRAITVRKSTEKPNGAPNILINTRSVILGFSTMPVLTVKFNRGPILNLRWSGCVRKWGYTLAMGVFIGKVLTLWLFNIAVENHRFLSGKSSSLIMCHLYMNHSYIVTLPKDKHKILGYHIFK